LFFQTNENLISVSCERTSSLPPFFLSLANIMTILYALVANGITVLAEYSPHTGNFVTIARQILQNAAFQKAGKKSYVYGGKIFLYMKDDEGLIYLCMTDDENSYRVPFALMEDLRARFRTQFRTSYQSATENSLDDAFARVIQDRMDYFNHDPQADKITSVRDEIEKVKEKMVDNIELVLKRGERIETLIDETDSLSQRSSTFKTQSTKVKRKLRCKNWMLCGCIIVCLLILLVIIIAVILIFLHYMKWI